MLNKNVFYFLTICSFVLSGCFSPIGNSSSALSGKELFSAPDKFVLDSGGSAKFSLKNIDPSLFKEDKLELISTGSATCRLDIASVSASEREIVLSGCTGQGPVTVKYVNVLSFEILVNNDISTVYQTPFGIEIVGDNVYVADSSSDSLIRQNLKTGVKTVLVSAGLGNCVDVTVNSDETKAYTVNSSGDSIIEVDLSDYSLNVISDTGMPNLSYPTRVTISKDENFLYIVDRNLKAVVELDLSDNSKRIVTDSANTSTIPLDIPYSLAVDETYAYVFDRDQKSLFKIDIASGDREIVSSNSVGSGVVVNKAHSLTFLSDNEMAYVDIDSDIVVKVNLDSGDREIISDNASFDGPELQSLFSVKKYGDYLIVGDSSQDALIKVSLKTGHRSFIGK